MTIETRKKYIPFVQRMSFTWAERGWFTHQAGAKFVCSASLFVDL